MTAIPVPWYKRYPAILDEVKSLQVRFDRRCSELQVVPGAMAFALRRDFLTRAVHESNWQEGVELDIGRTAELTALAFDDDLRFTDDSRLDLEGIVKSHREQVLTMKKRRATLEEVATVNLARAHVAVAWISMELAIRQTASLAYALNQAIPYANEILKRDPDWGGVRLLEKLRQSKSPIGHPVVGSHATQGELLDSLLRANFETLLHPMDERYLHALHRLSMMGVVRSSDLGRWRRSPVHVGNPDLDFPPPEAVPAMMTEFAREFPTILPSTTKYEPIMMAARWSYRFVRIHPYIDGNGRMSRLIMNLILHSFFPVPISLAPRAKQRHRYKQALHRADRGNIEPLACLIAISVCDAYERMLSAIEAPSTKRLPTNEN